MPLSIGPQKDERHDAGAGFRPAQTGGSLKGRTTRLRSRKGMKETATMPPAVAPAAGAPSAPAANWKSPWDYPAR